MLIRPQSIYITRKQKLFVFTCTLNMYTTVNSSARWAGGIARIFDASHLLPVIGCQSLVASHVLPVTCCQSRVASHVLPVICCKSSLTNICYRYRVCQLLFCCHSGDARVQYDPRKKMKIMMQGEH
jgi:hypothetical protein